jgi:hypothetical protein
MKSARIIAWAAPAVVVLTLAAAGTGLAMTPMGQNGLSVAVGSACAYIALGPASTAAAEYGEPPTQLATAPPAPIPDTSLVIATPPGSSEGMDTVVVAPTRVLPEELDPVDYARLNQDVRVVADTLERFNQKLLRMIAQARAAKLRADAQAASESGPEADPDAAASLTQPVPITPLDVDAGQ